MTMIPLNTPNADCLIPPACRATVDRLQLVLDGDETTANLELDPHPAVCAACRGRIAAARIMLSILATPAEPRVSPELTNRILNSLGADRRTRTRRRAFALAGGFAFAAAACVALWFAWPTPLPGQPDVAVVNPVPPVVEPAPEPPPIRIGAELTKAGQALRDTPKAITSSASAAPEMFAKLTDAFTRPATPLTEIDAPGAALADIPTATRTGLEPVTGTAQKAFARLMRDVGGIAGNARPKS